MIHFSGEQHKSRFLELLETFGKIYKSGEIDSEYGTAYYILTADDELYSKAKAYIHKDGISFLDMLENQDFSSGYLKLVQLSANLFNGNFHDEVSPLDLCWLDDMNFKIAMNALELRRTKTYFEELKKTRAGAGRPKTIESAKIQILKAQGYTQEKTAQELGVSLSTVRRAWH